MAVVPAVVTLLVVCWQIQRPSYWRDEGATLSAVTRPPGSLIRMLGHADAVHGAYYLLMWAVVRVGGTGEAVTRLPSALAMAVAAGLIALTGRELVSARAGLLAGLLFAALPEITRYGQEARSYAAVTALAAAASYFLIRMLRAAGTGAGPPAGPPAAGPGEGPRQREWRRWLLAYALALAALGLANIFALALIPAHAVTVGLARRRSLLAGWLAAAVTALVAAAPVAWFAWQQRDAQQWLKTPRLGTLGNLHFLIGSFLLIGLLALIVAWSVARSRRAGPARATASWPGPLVALAVPWALVPPAVLISASLIQPVYTLRYVLFCLPAVALIAGAGLATLDRRVIPVALALVVVFALPGQIAARRAAAHGDNIRRADGEIAAAYQPGDAVLYENRDARYMAAAYPYGLAQLRNIALAAGKDPSATLAGVILPRPAIHRRLARVHRVWVVAIGKRPLTRLPILHNLNYHLVRRYHPSDLWLVLYQDQPLAARPAPPPVITPAQISPVTGSLPNPGPAPTTQPGP